MRRCYQNAAFAVGMTLIAGMAFFNSCGMGPMTVYAAEDGLTEEMATAFQEEVQVGVENVETNVPVEQTVNAVSEVPVEQAVMMDPASIVGQEYEVLLRIVEAEAGSEDTTGKLLVANVVMNRMRSAKFPNTVTEVVYQRHNGKAQFSPVDNGRINTVNVSSDTVEAVGRALAGEDVSAGALYFRSVHSKCGWFDRALTRVVEHGNHIFYAI